MAFVDSLIVTESAEETMLLGEKFGKTLPTGSIVCFFGDLAAGKTTFIKGLVKGAAQLDNSSVVSPTFVYLNVYEGEKVVYHFDLYRLKGAGQFMSMGFDEYLYSGGIACIEWSERIESLLPQECILVKMTSNLENRREIAITYPKK